jgi:hypothetical protein
MLVSGSELVLVLGLVSELGLVLMGVLIGGPNNIITSG